MVWKYFGQYDSYEQETIFTENDGDDSIYADYTKNGLEILKDFNNIEDSSIYYYDKIINNNFAYNFNKIVAVEIDNVTKESLILFYKKHFDLNKYLSIKIKKLNI